MCKAKASRKTTRQNGKNIATPPTDYGTGTVLYPVLCIETVSQPDAPQLKTYNTLF